MIESLSLINSAVMLMYPFLCGHLYVYLNANWVKYKMCFLRPGDFEFKGIAVKIYQAGFTMALCAQEHLLLLMWDLDFGRRIYLCWSFTSYYVLLLTGGVCDLSFFKASCWLVILGVENNLKKIWNILKKSSKHKSLKIYIYINSVDLGYFWQLFQPAR